MTASLRLNNLLKFSVLQYQKDEGIYFVNSSYNPGRTFTLGFTYSIH